MTVLYVAGLSHCGSTLTTRLLHEHSSIFAAGELIYLYTLYNEGRGEKITCRCENIDPRECEFWNDELLPAIRELSEETWKMCKVDTHPPTEWMKALAGITPEESDKSFGDLNRELFTLLQEGTKSDVIIDSSKTIWRLLPLYRALGDDIKVLHVIKSPENQVGSRYKRGMNSFFRSAIIKYGRRNFLYEYLFGGDDRYKKVRFEKLAENFEEAMGSIYDWLDLEYEDPLEGPDNPWHHLGGSKPKLTKPDPERIQKDIDYSPLQQFTLNRLRALY